MKGLVCLLSNSFSSKQILLYLWRGHFSRGETNQILLHTGEWVKPVALEHCYQGLNMSHLLQLWFSGDLRAGKSIFSSLTCPPSASARYCDIQQPDSTCSCFKAESFGAPCSVCVFIYSFFACLVNRNFSEGVVLPYLD